MVDAAREGRDARSRRDLGHTQQMFQIAARFMSSLYPEINKRGN